MPRAENQVFIHDIHYLSISTPRAPASLARPPLLSSPVMPLCRPASKCVESLGHEYTDVVGENRTLHLPVNLLVIHALTYVSHSTKTPGFKHLHHSEVGGAEGRPPDRACITLHRKIP